MGYSILNTKTTIDYTPLHHAAEMGNLKVVKYLLSKGARKEAKNYKNQTPFDLTKIQKRILVMRVLSNRKSKNE
jgi:ankyrin repeat protein